MIDIVVYARYSSLAQTEQSIEGQLRVCNEYAQRNKYNILHEYIDRATTGTNDKRPAFLQMIEDSKRKKFKYILVYKLDRFSRNKFDNAIYKHILAQNGVKVISATEAISNTPEGVLLEGLLEMFAELYSQDLSQKVKRGVRESILKGNFIGGNVLYGYKVVDKKIVIDEDTAPAIRYLFQEYASGKSKKKIIQELNAKGYRTQKGKPLTLNSFQNNLSNKKYIGVYEKDDIVKTDYYPAIIDKQTFEQVQEKLKQHKQQPATQKAKIEYILTGKLFCGHCGEHMVGVSGTSKTKDRHYYYVCSKRYKTHNCHKKYEHKDKIENMVIMDTYNYILSDEQLDIIANGVLNEYKNNVHYLKLKEYEKQLKQVENKLDSCFKKFLNTTSEELIKRLNEEAEILSIQKQDIQTEIHKLQLAINVNHSKEDIINYIKYFFYENDPNNLEFRKKIVNLFVNSIYLYDDKIAIYYNLFDNHQITLNEANENIEFSQKVQILNTDFRQCIKYTNTCTFVFNCSYFGIIVKRQF